MKIEKKKIWNIKFCIKLVKMYNIMKLNNFLIIKYIVYDLVFCIYFIQKIYDRNKYEIIIFKYDLLNEW